MTEDDEATRALMYAAFEQAFQVQLGQLYKVYLSNVASSLDQAVRTKKGIDQAVEAYRLAIAAVDSWEIGDD